MNRVLAFATAVWMLAPMPGLAQSTSVIERCYLGAIDEVPVPATDPGMLVSIEVEEGAIVEKDQMVAKIDDREVVAARQVAMHDYQAQKKKAENEISVEAAVKSHEVAQAEMDKATEANRKVPGSYSDTEVRRLKLNWERAGLQIDLARYENVIAAIEARAKYSQYEQATAMIERRQLLAPHSGFVNQVFKNVGDWVTPGDPVMHLVRMDKLRVHGRVNGDEFTYRDLLNRQVTVEVTLAGGQTQSVNARIGFASPVIEDDGSFRVWADIDNPKDGNGWILGPGMHARIVLR
jgi:macrolide-specific efflux system membrane fusion protein